MNLPLDGVFWRMALRAIPESTRDDVLGTLREFHGTTAPITEAFSAIVSGSRMKNRADGSSPVDLWREAARNAQVFVWIAVGIAGLGTVLAPPPFWQPRHTWQTAPTLAFVVLGLCLRRGVYLRLVALALMAWTTLVIMLADSRGAPSVGVRIGIVIALVGVCASLLHKSIAGKYRLAIVCVPIACVLGWHVRTETFGFDSSRFVMVTAITSCLGSVGIIGWIAAANAPSRKVWWPVLLGTFLGACAAVANTQPANELLSLAGHAIGVFLVLLAVVSVLVVAVRPHLFLAIAFVVLHAAIRSIAIAGTNRSAWTARSAIPILFGAGMVAAAVIGSRKARRV